jgi:plasmid rolling circle replication initiator protein Rep
MYAITPTGEAIDLPDEDPSRGDPLFDVSPRTAKLKPWNTRKRQSRAITMAYHKAHLNTGDETFSIIRDRMKDCGNWLCFDVAKGNGRVERKLRRANFCRSRLCMMCAWRRSQKLGKELELVCSALEKGPPVKALMLTLTMRSVPLNAGLAVAVTHLLDSFGRLTKLKAWKDSVKHWFRGLEVSIKDGMAHPHLHVILFVEDDYFDPTKGLYIAQPRWADYWGRALRVDYKPIVDIRRCTRVIEAAKYIVKPGDFVQVKGEKFFVDWEVIACLHYALSSRRFVGWSASLVEMRKGAGLVGNGGDSDDENLTDTEPFESGMRLSHREIYEWRRDLNPDGDYRLARRIELEDG